MAATRTPPDAQIAALRRLARAQGWQVSKVTAARKRPAVALVASRIYRPGWSPGNASVQPQWQELAINRDALEGVIRARGSYRSCGRTTSVFSLDGVEAIEAALRSPVGSTDDGVARLQAALTDLNQSR